MPRVEVEESVGEAYDRRGQRNAAYGVGKNTFAEVQLLIMCPFANGDLRATVLAAEERREIMLAVV